MKIFHDDFKKSIASAASKANNSKTARRTKDYTAKAAFSTASRLDRFASKLKD